MSADFWAGYVSGAIGILVGNPLDITKTKLQAGSTRNAADISLSSQKHPKCPERWTSFARGAAAPILGYGALNALLFVTYNRSLALLSTGNLYEWPERPSSWRIWTAGALGGLATFFVSAPTELVKCRAQVSLPSRSSLQVARELWASGGVRGMYLGGGITSVRDAVGYGFYFWSYELSKRALANEADSQSRQALKVLLCGGLAGVVTWMSIFPLGIVNPCSQIGTAWAAELPCYRGAQMIEHYLMLRGTSCALPISAHANTSQDAIKTRVQTWDLVTRPKIVEIPAASQPLLAPTVTRKGTISDRPSTFAIASEAYRAEGLTVFFRGLGVCSARAFIVNAVQWAVYEWTMKVLAV